MGTQIIYQVNHWRGLRREFRKEPILIWKGLELRRNFSLRLEKVRKRKAQIFNPPKRNLGEF